MIMKVVNVNITADLNIFESKSVHLVKMHLSETRPKQFEDSFGNLWYSSEISNLVHNYTYLKQNNYE